MLPTGTWRYGRSKSSLRAWRRPAGERRVWAPPCPLGFRTPQDGRPRAAWPDEENRALANSRLLDLWVVALVLGARVCGWSEKGPFTLLGLRGPAPGARAPRPPRGRLLLLLYPFQALESRTSRFELQVLPPNSGAAGGKGQALLSERLP